jgi:DNA-binding protein YbaB
MEKIISTTGNLFIDNDVSLNGNLNVKNINIENDLSLNGNLFIENILSLNGNLFIDNDVSLNGNLNVKNINIENDVLLNGHLNVRNISIENIFIDKSNGNRGEVIISNGLDNSVSWSSEPVFTFLTAETYSSEVTDLKIDFLDNGGFNKLIRFHTSYPNLFMYVRNNEIGVQFNGISGNLYLNYSGGIVFYGNTPTALSDDRIKFNETNITNGLEVIRKLSPERYTKRLPNQTTGSEEAGFIAQEVLTIPELRFAVTHPDKEIIEGDPNTRYYTLTYDSIFTYAVAGLKELDTIVQKQAQSISSLEARINTLEGN